jgi:hypothetical protein
MIDCLVRSKGIVEVEEHSHKIERETERDRERDVLDIEKVLLG